MSLIETCPAVCPYCGERIELVIDTTIPQQEYIEDCPVCCQPMNVLVSVDGAGGVTLNLVSVSE